MVPLDQFTSVGGLAVLLVIIAQLIKQKWPPRWGGPEAVPYLTILLGVILAPLINVSQGTLTEWGQLLGYILGGLFAALLAIGGYEATLDKVKGLFGPTTK